METNFNQQQVSSLDGFLNANPRIKDIIAATTLTDADSGSIINAEITADVAVTLPNATVGKMLSFYVNATAFELRITPQSTEYMSLHTGAVQAVGKYVNNVGEVPGQFYQFLCLNEGIWACINAVGTLEAES